MALFEKSLQAVANLDSIMTTANKTFEIEKKKAMDTYKDPVSHIGKLRAVLLETEEQQKLIFSETVKAEFAAVRDMVNKIVTTDAPLDFPATLEAIRVNGKGITEYEASAFLEKYKNNYLAFRTLADLLHKHGRAANISVLYPDAIMDDINDGERLLLNWGIQYKGSSYMGALLQSDNNPITALAVTVNEFLEGRYTLSE